ncbi:MAG: RHS repeat-associated core domain-containing protein, partial [Bacteroidota bacterium]
FLDPDKPTTPSTILGQTVTTNVKGLTVAHWSRTLEDNTWTKTYSFYDFMGRPIQSHNKNQLGGYTKVESEYDFRGKANKNVTRQKRLATDTELMITDRFVYDHVERTRAQYQQTNSDPEKLISGYLYDAVGQLLVKYIEPQDLTFGYEPASSKGGKSSGYQLKDIHALQKIDYKYNTRGSLTEINDVDDFNETNGSDDVFAYKINFDNVEGFVGSEFELNYNNNITQVLWKTANDNVKRNYKYTYDALNQLKSADFSSSSYDLESVTYDKNGNILSLDRKTLTGYQNFSYHYNNGNQLTSVTGVEMVSGTETGVNKVFTYDANGNMTSDLDKGITSITYNHLNLPESVNFSTGEVIEYDYDASGIKLQKRFIDGSTTTTTDYIGGTQYVNTVLQFIQQPEGYAAPDGSGGFDYVYNYTDHLGNIRLSYHDTNGDGRVAVSEIVKERNYYPFGLTHNYNTGVLSLGTMFHFEFNGQELQSENGLAWLDFGSRNYDPELGRWFNPDPMGQFNSPYVYAFNNPVTMVDPDGEFAFTAVLIGAIIGATTGAVAYTVSAIQTGDWSLGGFLGATAGGALAGAIGGALAPNALPAVLTQGKMLGYAAGAGLSTFFPSLTIPLGENFSIGISPAIAFGNAGGLGANVSANASVGEFHTSVGFGTTYFTKAHGTGASGLETRVSAAIGYSSDNFSTTLYTTSFKDAQLGTQQVG